MIVTFNPEVMVRLNEEIIEQTILECNDTFEFCQDYKLNRILVRVKNLPKDKPVYGLHWEIVSEVININ